MSVVLLFVTSVLGLVAHDAPVVTAAVQAAESSVVPAAATMGASPAGVLPVPPTSASTTTAVAPTGGSAPTTGAPAADPSGARVQHAAASPASPATAATTQPPLLPPINIPLLAPPTTPPPAGPAPASAASAGAIAPYLGLGTWVDVYDWSILYSKGSPTVGPGDVDGMVGAGVQTLYLQASKHDAPADVLEPDLLQAIIDRASGRGLRVVVWYLPTLVDTGADLRRLKAVAGLRNIDGIAVDIEARNVPDVAERNRRLIDLSGALRRELPGRTIGAIMLPPVVMEVVNTSFWPNFPYREIAPSFDVWMTMGYWTNRTTASGYRDAYRYTKENVDRLRNNLGQPDAPVHPIGGIGPLTTVGDIEGFKRAVTAVHGIGGSIYDWHTTAAALWENLRPMRLR